MNEEIEKLNGLIDELREEKEGAQRKRGEIVSKHRQLLTLKAELAKAQEKRAKAVKEKNALEQKYCENYMTEVVACYHGLDEKYNCLVGRTMSLIKTACASLDIKEVSRRIEQLNQ
jgi:chromosome segregation ATPase